MKWIEYSIAGAIGGALAAIGLFSIGAEGDLLDILASSLLQYANNFQMLLAAIFLGVLGGRFSKSGVGAILGGLAASLIIEALPLAF